MAKDRAGKINDDKAPRGILSKVAAEAGLSVGTVSRVFNNSPLIPPETRLKVMSIAREFGFRPRTGLRKKQIALITEPPHKTRIGGYVSSLTQYISFALSRANAGISLITEDHIDQLCDCWFDGVIGIAWEKETISRLKSIRNLPVVWFSDEFADSFHSIYLDPLEAGRIAADYLCSKGHRKIAVIHESDYTGKLRFKGFADSMRKKGLNPEKLLIDLPDTIPLQLAVKRVIDEACTALWVTGEDLKVVEVNWLLQELAGKRVPEDISLMGFENPGISEFQRPSLTNVATPLRDMAEKAVEIVLRDDLSELVKIQMHVTLIERTSVNQI